MSAMLILTLGITFAVINPAIGTLLSLAACVVQGAIVLVRVVVARIDMPRPRRIGSGRRLVFSVHVAIHDEPPGVVANTLLALSRQTMTGADFEVIVIDNNTSDPALWRPVEAQCARLGPRFRFSHRMGVTDAKAGALNIALDETRVSATHIITVDADYQVRPDFIAMAAQALHRTGADYIQFPQAYLGCDRVATGVDYELEEYFRANAQIADEVEAVLLTGTLCVISRAALQAAGGWSGRTTTEDAEMGVRLCRKGFSGRFIPMVMGRGYLPFSLHDLERQRHRWVSGNLRTLLVHAPAILGSRDGMGWRRRCAILSQLTAWLNFALVPTLLLLAALLTGRTDGALVATASAAVLLAFVDIVARLVWRGLRDGAAAGVIAAAIANRLALAPVSALATVEVLAGRPMHFVVTDKTGAGRSLRHKLPLATFVLFTIALLAFEPALQVGWLTTAAVIALMAPFPAALTVAWTLERYRSILTVPLNGAAA